MKSKRVWMGRSLLIVVPCLITAVPAHGLATARGLTRLGGLTTNNYIFSQAEDVSNDGTVVVGYSEIDSGHNQAFNFSYGGIHGMGFLDQGNKLSRAYSITPDGSMMVGESNSGNYPMATLWEAGVQYPPPLGYMHGATTTTWGTRAWAISADGNLIVGEGEYFNQLHAFIKVGDDLLRSINPPNIFGLKAEDVASNGTAVGWRRMSYYSNIYHAFRWRGNLEDVENFNNADNYEDLQTDYPAIEGSASSLAYAVSEDGAVVVGQSQTPMEALGEDFNWPAFRWENGQMMQLGYLDDNYRLAAAYDITADGSIVVGYSTISLYPQISDREAAFWIGGDAGSYPAASLNDWADANGIDREGFRMEEARGISDNGRFIVGYGRNNHGQHEAFMMVFSEQGCWGGWPIEEDNRTINTGDFLQEVDVEQSPFLYVHRIHGWVHALPEHISRNGAWVYIPAGLVEDLEEVDTEDPNWSYSKKLRTYLFRKGELSDANGDWTFLPL